MVYIRESDYCGFCCGAGFTDMAGVVAGGSGGISEFVMVRFAAWRSLRALRAKSARLKLESYIDPRGTSIAAVPFTISKNELLDGLTSADAVVCVG